MNGSQRVLDWPEDYLWVRHPGGYITVIDKDRLCELLYEGAAPEDQVEQLLVDNPEWLRIYLRHAIGEYCITITLGKPLPEWEPSWVDGVEG
jgi:hypothetical protein